MEVNQESSDFWTIRMLFSCLNVADNIKNEIFQNFLTRIFFFWTEMLEFYGLSRVKVDETFPD